MKKKEQEETYPFINNCLDHLLSDLDSAALTDDGDGSRVTSLGTRAILALGRHLDVGHAAGLLDLIDLSTLRTNDLAGGTLEDLHLLLALLLVVVIVFVIGGGCWFGFRDEPTVLLIT